MNKRIIWSNRDVNPDDWREAYKEEAELNEWDEDTDDESNLWSFIEEMLDRYLDDERMNLNKETEGRILVIGDLGFWHGRKQGYKILGTNVNDILHDDSDYVEWYGDGKNIRATASHHDGTNFYLYRVIREDRNIDNLLEDIYSGKGFNLKKLNYYTKSLYPYVKEVYGW